MNKPARVLLVDDDASVLELYSHVLAVEGYEFSKAGTGHRGIEIARELRPDLVLLDVGLPDISGIEVCRQLRADPRLQDTVVVLISGAAIGAIDKVQGLETGADDYLLKSADWNEIRARLRMLLRLRDATAALRASEQHYRRLVEILPDAVSIVDLQGRLMAVNSQAARMLGYENQEELLGKSAFEVTPPEEHATVSAQISAALEAGVLRDIESVALTKNGERFPVELSIATLRDAQDVPSGLVCVWRDISRRKHAADQLRASEERIRQITDNIREVFWMTNLAKTEMIYISPGYERIWGRTCQSLYESPRTWVESLHPDDRDRVLDAAMHKQVIGEYDEIYRIVRPDGTIRWIQDRAFPVLNEANEVYRIVGIGEDITEWVRAEQSLRESDARKSAIMQAALDAIITFNQQGQILEVNFAAERIFGYPAKEMIGRDLAEILLPPSLHHWFRAGLGQLFAVDDGPALGSRIEVTALRAHHVEFPVEISITRIELIGAPLFTAFFRDISGRRRTEAKLATLVHAIETTAETIYMTDLKDRITFVNRAFQTTYGYSEREVIGKSPALLFPENLSNALAVEIRTQTHQGGWRGEVTHRRRDGGEHPVFLSTSQIQDRAGQVIGYIHVAQDISKRRQSEEKLRLLADAVRSAQDLIYITDARNRICFVNHAFHEAYGHGDGEILGKTPEVLCSRKVPRKLRNEILKKTGEGGWRGELIHCTKDGREFPVSLTTSPIMNQDGSILNLVYVARDISERRQAQEALEESQRLQRAILDNISDPVWLRDRNGRFLAGNEPLARFLGRTLDELVGRSTVQPPSPEADQLTRGDEDILRLRRPAIVETAVRDTRGRVSWFEILKSPIFDNHGHASGTVGIARNITERIQVEAVLRELPARIIAAQEAERLRVARDLHDGVNQTIASVKMRIHNVSESLAGVDPAAREILARCEKLLVRTIEENRRIAYNLRPSDLDEFGLATACRNFCNELQARTSLKIDHRISRRGRRLPAAVELNLFRILQEAVNNIEKYAGAKTVRVSLSFPGKNAVLQIQDDGCGFELKSASASRRRRKGMGITNMLHRAEAVGGTCAITSAPGKGATVTVRVPLGGGA